MFGRQTTGIVLASQGDIIELIMEVGCDMHNDQDRKKFMDEVRVRKWDNLGKQYIAY